jgi:transcriptional regulator of acetoin/glycerol metabolism
MRGEEIRTEDLLLANDEGVARSSSEGPAAEWEIRPLDDVVADYVTAAVKAADGNMRKAARLLQISPSTLYARMKKER